jgi:hypothetical protein
MIKHKWLKTTSILIQSKKNTQQHNKSNESSKSDLYYHSYIFCNNKIQSESFYIVD